VARAIHSEVKAGRGSPHGGVFLDIHSRRSAEDIKRKLPAMYHQFKELGDIDITKEPMEVGPTTHYVMGGIRVDGDTQMSTVAGLFAAGECAAGLHGANRLGGNSLSDLLVFGKRAGEHAARFARAHGTVAVDTRQAEAAERAALEPFDRSPDGTGGPFQIQHALQDLMQDLVGIVRQEDEMKRALDAIDGLERRTASIAVAGNREYNPGWHTALDLPNLLTVARAITLSAIERRESRGGHFRDDYPGKDASAAGYNILVRQGPNGDMELTRAEIPPMPPALTAVIAEMG
jgi:succinate dehydrogenase / fumarate reductase, flavoprotein subunit